MNRWDLPSSPIAFRAALMARVKAKSETTRLPPDLGDEIVLADHTMPSSTSLGPAATPEQVTAGLSHSNLLLPVATALLVLAGAFSAFRFTPALSREPLDRHILALFTQTENLWRRGLQVKYRLE